MLTSARILRLVALEQDEELAGEVSAVAPAPLLRRLFAGGTEGNSQLTTATGALLLVLLLVYSITIVANLFIGMLLLGPVALKLSSVGYRFTRYYTGNARYVAKGAPEMVMRVLGPFVVISTVAVFASGVVLLLAGPGSRSPWNPIHKYSFMLWLAIWWGHVILHLPDLPKLLRARASQRERPWDDYGSGRGGRALSLAGALVGGLVLAIVTIPLYSAWSSALH
jgi:hypothetical protein